MVADPLHVKQLQTALRQGETSVGSVEIEVLGVSKVVSTELICNKSGCQKSPAVHTSLLLSSSQTSEMMEGELISAEPDLNTGTHSNTQLA